MKNIQMAEIINKKDILINYPDLSIMDLINIIEANEKSSLFYFVNSLGKYIGAVSKKDLLEYISTYAFFINRDHTDNFITQLKKTSISNTNIIDPNIPKITELEHLPKALSQLSNSTYNTLPVIDSTGVLIGEVTLNSILNILTKKKYKANVSA